MQEISDILIQSGYQLKDFGTHWRTTATYRGGTNSTSLSIDKETGHFTDFSTGKSGSFKQLLKLIAGDLKDVDIDTILERIKFQISQKEPKQKIKKATIYPNDCLERLLPHWDFYLKIGISRETLEKFQMGLAQSGKLNHRYCFPVYNKNDQIEGFAGRWYKKVPDFDIVKWKIIGKKADFVFPQHLNKDADFKTVILVESVGDVLRLFNVGITNVFCLFGTSLSSKIILHLIGLNPEKIVLSLNRDGDGNNHIGEEACEKAKKKLLKFFDKNKILIKLPPQKDFGDSTNEETKLWYQNI